MRFFQDLLAFILSVVSHWQAYLTGGAVMAALFVYERLSHKEVPSQWVFWGVVVFLLASFFLTWREEHAKVILADQRFTRLGEEKSSPQVILRYQLTGWLVFNDGAAAAYNVTSDAIYGSGLYAVIAHVDRVPPREERRIQFIMSATDGRFTDRYAQGLEQVFQSLMHHDLMPPVQVLLRYSDVFGKDFESLCEINFLPGITSQPAISHKYVRLRS